MGSRKTETIRAEVETTSMPRAPSRQRTYLYTAGALLSLVGLADAIYLTIEHLAGRSVQCTITSGCEEVLNSVYATVGGVPLAALGAAAYFTVFSLAVLAAFGNRWAAKLMLYAVGLMLAVSIYLFILQAFVLRAFCQFCLLSAAVTVLLAIIVTLERFYVRPK